MPRTRTAPAPNVDPITGAVEAPANNREPRFVLHEREQHATAKLDEFVARTGRRPNVLVILMDDVGWGDFGCYGGGIAFGAPTPNIDKLAREGLLLTSCYSEPSCTPTRASIMTGRLPMRHGLLVPPMYGMPGGLQGEVTLPQPRFRDCPVPPLFPGSEAEVVFRVVRDHDRVDFGRALLDNARVVNDPNRQNNTARIR